MASYADESKGVINLLLIVFGTSFIAVTLVFWYGVIFSPDLSYDISCSSGFHVQGADFAMTHPGKIEYRIGDTRGLYIVQEGESCEKNSYVTGDMK